MDFISKFTNLVSFILHVCQVIFILIMHQNPIPHPLGSHLLFETYCWQSPLSISVTPDNSAIIHDISIRCRTFIPAKAQSDTVLGFNYTKTRLLVC